MTSFLNPAYIISVLIAIAVHEWAHAMTAHKLGDPTPGYAGRLTLNPIAHLDLLGALMFVVVGFGWAKPVPVDPRYFRHPKRDMSLTAIAGPFSNLVLALLAYIGLTLLAHAHVGSIEGLLSAPTTLPIGEQVFLQILQSSLFVNLALMAFNLLPIAPLDGSNVLHMFIPRSMEDRYEQYLRVGPWILIGLIVFESLLPVPVLSLWVHGIMSAVLSLFEMIF
jgi:Zn-dependent protease